MKSKRSVALFILFIIVITNYIAQIPYDLHLYGGRYNSVGILLLGITFAWFIIGILLTLTKIKLGYWILLSFLLAQFIFYFYGQIIMMIVGYGLLYHLLRFKDMILWWVFFIGDINFFAAGFYIYYLLKNRVLFL